MNICILNKIHSDSFDRKKTKVPWLIKNVVLIYVVNHLPKRCPFGTHYLHSSSFPIMSLCIMYHLTYIFHIRLEFSN